MKKATLSQIASLAFGVLVLCFVVGFYAISWQGPTASPPEGNVPPPVRLAPANPDQESTSSPSIWINDTGGGDLMVLNTTGGDDLLVLQKGGTTKFVVGNDGNVVIGGNLTFTPSANRTISIGTTNMAYDLTIQPGYNGPLGESGNLIFATGQGTERMRIDKYGNVGIGTINPQGKLDISGGALAVGGSAGTSGQVLTSQGAGVVPIWKAPSGGGGQTLYDAVVALSGGDYTSIQDALNAGKKNIFVRKGTYTISSAISITASNISIIGEDKEGVIIWVANGANSNGITIGDGTNSYSNIVIKNLTLNGNKANQTSGTGIYLNINISDFRIEENHIYSFKSYGISAVGGNGTEIRNGFIIKNTINENGTSYPNVGIRLNEFHKNIVISKNYIYANKEGINADGWLINNLVISDNFIYQNTGRGISSSAPQTIISGNQIFENNSDGIFSNVDRATIIGNSLRNNSQNSASTNKAEILLAGAYCVVNSNIIYIAAAIKSDYGIYESDGTGYNTVVGNSATGATIKNVRMRVDGGSIEQHNYGGTP